MGNCNKKIFDYHVHIGQFENVYYNPYKVINILFQNHVNGAYISSTTSCIAWDNDSEKNIIISHIKDELSEAIEQADEIGFDVRPLCWIIPQRYLEGESIEHIYSECKYCGFKIHPRAHEWNLDDVRIWTLMDEVCCLAEVKKVPVLIHTGLSDFELPNKFEHWFAKYPDVIFIVAHCKAVDEVISLFTKYQNVYGDTAFLPYMDFAKVESQGYVKRLLFGTDFPITSYYSDHKSAIEAEWNSNYNMILKEWETAIPKMSKLCV